MKEQLKKLWKKHSKSMVGVFSILVVAVTAILIHGNLESKERSTEEVYDRVVENINTPEEVQTSTESSVAAAKSPIVKEVPASNGENSSKEEMKVPPIEAVSNAENKSTVKVNEEKEDATKADNKTSGDQLATKKQPAEPTKGSKTEPTTIPPTVQENKYVPISEGWKASKSVQGDITSAQKNDLDDIIEMWKSGDISDSELKEKIVKYLEEQEVDYVEVSVTSKGYALYDKIPEIDLRSGGNLYSFVGTYSTGKQNPDGTNKTVCYNWSVFIL